jgi:hypothetical protein
MEQIIDYSCFIQYKDRQVVLNYYQDDDFLWKRDGFCFDSIQLTNGQLLFIKNDSTLETINLAEFEWAVVNTDFPNCYMFQNGMDILEIYFP